MIAAFPAHLQHGEAVIALKEAAVDLKIGSPGLWRRTLLS